MKILYIIFLLLIPLKIMAAHSSGHHDAHINWFSRDTESPPVGWGVINFVIFFGILFYLSRKAVRRFFKNRYETMKLEMNESIKLRNEALSNLKEIEDKLSRIEYYQSAIKEEYIDMAKKEKEDILNHARRTAQSLISAAEQTILFETVELKKEIIRQILKRATEKSLSIVLSKFSPQRDREIIEEFVNSLSSVNKKHFGYLI